MGSRTWIVFAAMGAAVAAAAVAVTWQRLPEFRASPPNAECVPDGAVFYAEANGLAPVWRQVTGTQAWKDATASTVVKDALASETGRAWTDLVREIETRGGYALDEARAMHFLGRQVSLAVDAAPAGDAPTWAVLAKLDVDALVRETLRGEGADWTQLQDELARRTGAMAFVVTSAEHKGRKITTAARGDVTFHAAIVGDTLAVASSDAYLRRVIDVHDAGGEGSLGRTQRFREEIARLPKGALAYDFTNLAALREGRDAWRKVVAARAPDRADVPRAVDALLDGTAGSPALARATELPGGDLYEVRWSYSRTAAELAGVSKPASVVGAVAGCPVVVEVRDVGRVAAAWDRSALRRKLSEGPFGQTLRGWLDDPAQAIAAARRLPFAGAGAAEAEEFEDFDVDDEEMGAEDAADEETADDETAAGEEEGTEEEDVAAGEDEDEGDDDAGVAAPAAPKVDAFTAKLVWNLARRSLANVSTGDAALGLDLPESGPPASVMGLRLGTEMYLLWLVAESLEPADAAWRRTDVGGRVVLEFPAQRGAPEGARVARAGDVLLLATGGALLQRAVDGSASAPAAPETDLEPGWVCRAAWDGRALGASFARATGDAPNSKFFATLFGERGECGVYVDDALKSVRLESRVRHATEQPPFDAAAASRAWDALPASTIVAQCAGIDLAATWKRILAVAPRAVRDMSAEMESAAKETLGVGVADELLPALGPSFTMAFTYAPPPPGPPNASGGPAVPGVLLACDARDPALVGRVFDRAVEAIESSLAESRSSARRVPRLVRESAGGVRRVHLDLPGAPPGVRPTLVLAGNRLVLALNGQLADGAIAQDASASFARSPVGTRIAAEGTSAAAGVRSVVDWNRLLDQVAAYAPQIAQLVPAPAGGAQPPELPEDADEAAVERYLDEQQRYETETAAARAAEVTKWIDACRVVDFIAGESEAAGKLVRSRTVVRFAD